MIRGSGVCARSVTVVCAILATGAAACGRDTPPLGEVAAGSSDGGERIEIRYARQFDVEYRDGYKVVRTRGEVSGFQSTDDPDPVEDVLVLVPRGATPPALAGDLADAAVVEVPVRTLAVNDDDMVALVTALGLRDALRAVGGLYTYDDTVRTRAEQHTIGQIGYSWHLPPNIEVLLTYRPDLVFLAVDAPHNIPAIRRVRELGIAAAPTFVWAERHYLGRAEWLKYFALFFGREAEANRIFAEVEQHVLRLRSLTAQVVDTPTVAWGYHAGSGRWFMAVNNIEAHLLRDAAGRNPFENHSGPHRPDGERLSSEALLAAASEVDHWVIGDIHGSELPPESFMRAFRAWREDNLYHNYARSKPEANAYDWFGTAVVRPDIVLADLISLIHPELLPDHQAVFLGHFIKSGLSP